MATNSSIERLAARLGIGSGSRQIGRTTLVRLCAYYGVVLVVVAGFIILTDNMKGLRLTDARAGEPAVSAALATDTAPGLTELTGSLWAPLFRSLPPLGRARWR